ncbi:MAG: hypothetical protein ABW022_20265 [Actinoplanes sp.]
MLAGLALQFLLPLMGENTGLFLACAPIAVAGGYAWHGLRRQARSRAGRERKALRFGAAAGGLLGVAYLLYTAEAATGGIPLLGTVADVTAIIAAVTALPALVLAVPPFPDGLTRAA